MSCYHPVDAFRTPTGVVFDALSRHDILGPIKLPCGMCIGCRTRRASDWALRVMHEASLWPVNCFVTLTYGTGKVPVNGSLDHRDFQLFMKRLRISEHRKVRFYMCGEYGPLHGRPHYHACLFNVDFSDRVPAGKSASGQVFYTSKRLEALWTHGNVSVQDLCRETAGYCARYIMKKALGEDAKTARHIVDISTGEICEQKAEYSAMSLKPGIGAEWFKKYGHSDVFRHDFVIANGMKNQVPKYYDKLLKRSKSVVADDIEYKRQLRARAQADNSTADRLAVREVVHTAKFKSFTRNDV